MKYIIGIDEAGRGAWAGPVVAGAFCAPLDLDFSIFPGLTDSKKLTPSDRERLFRQIMLQSEASGYFCASESMSSEVIDRVGIREANRLAMEGTLSKILEKVKPSDIREVQIDGRDNYLFENIAREKVRYIVRGDLTEKVISAASIVAKVTRDQKMRDFSVEYPGYFLDLHKGYGTRKHQEALLNYAITPIHRKSYAPIKRLISGDS